MFLIAVLFVLFGVGLLSKSKVLIPSDEIKDRLGIGGGSDTESTPAVDVDGRRPASESDRVILHQTMIELEDKIKSIPTSFRRKEFLSQFLGKWMRLEGSVSDIDVGTNGRWLVFVEADGAVVGCFFASGASISHAEQGDRIQLMGRLAYTGSALFLEDCELLDQVKRPRGDSNDVSIPVPSPPPPHPS